LILRYKRCVLALELSYTSFSLGDIDIVQ
jgi:hypothetical protein